MNKPAYSLAFSLVIMTAIMIIAATTIENTLSKLRFYADIEGTAQARLQAESAIDRALVKIKDGGFGNEPIDSNMTNCNSEDFTSTPLESTCNVFTIYSRAEYIGTDESASFYESYIPIQNTGTAGHKDECQKTSSRTFTADHPCNWNKIRFGETVVLPIHLAKNNACPVPGDGLPGCSPFEQGITEMIWHFRTPCENALGESCKFASDRYQLKDEGSTQINRNNTILTWEFLALVDHDDNPSTPAQKISLVPNDEQTCTSGPSGLTCERSTVTNTELYESLLNDSTANNYSETIKLTSGASIPTSFNTVFDFLQNAHFSPAKGIEGMYLKFSVISPLIDENDAIVPYLEWQIKYYDSDPVGDATGMGNGETFFPPDNKVVLTGKGFYNGKNGVYYFPIEVWRSVVDEVASPFTVSNQTVSVDN